MFCNALTFISVHAICKNKSKQGSNPQQSWNAIDDIKQELLFPLDCDYLFRPTCAIVLLCMSQLLLVISTLMNQLTQSRYEMIEYVITN